MHLSVWEGMQQEKERQGKRKEGKSRKGEELDAEEKAGGGKEYPGQNHHFTEGDAKSQGEKVGYVVDDVGENHVVG